MSRANTATGKIERHADTSTEIHHENSLHSDPRSTDDQPWPDGSGFSAVRSPSGL